MDTLYNISEKLLSTFAEIEAAEGELTPELEEALAIGETQLYEKLTAYKNYVLELKGDIEKCKCEENRIKENRKVREGRIERLKSAMLDAVIAFGREGKTNKFIELPDARIFSRGSEQVIINEDKFDILAACVIEMIKRYEVINSMSDEEILSELNDMANSQFGLNPSEYFTINDIKYLNVNVEKTYSLYGLLKGNYSITQDIKRDPVIPSTHHIILESSKTDIGNLMKLDKHFGVAHKEYNVSLQIK